MDRFGSEQHRQRS